MRRERASERLGGPHSRGLRGLSIHLDDIDLELRGHARPATRAPPTPADTALLGWLLLARVRLHTFVSPPA